jgi:hypothetical protein
MKCSISSAPVFVFLIGLLLVAGEMFKPATPPAGHVSASKLVAGRLFKPAMPPAGHFSLREEK